MNSKNQNRETEELNVEKALRNFRRSIDAWSENEFDARANRLSFRTAKASSASKFLNWTATPVLRWSLAGAIAISAVAVPMGIQHERHLTAERLAAQLKLEQQKAAEAAAAPPAISDEELMSHVDSDIAQSTPDAMEPLASLMADPSAQ